MSTHTKTTLSNQDKSKLSTQEFQVEEICSLNSFDTQLQFETKVKNFFQLEKIQKKRILIVQSDLNDQNNSDLVSCARHVIVETRKNFANTSTNLIFLLISIPIEKVENFIGFQLSSWSCYHLDELEDETNEIPSFEYLTENSIGQLLDNKETNMDLKLMLEKLTYKACSLVYEKNSAHNQRTIRRVEIFNKLCSQNDAFVDAIVSIMKRLQHEKEDRFLNRSQLSKWLKLDAVKKSQMEKNLTLRKSCQNYFVAKLSPLLAYLLAKVDRFSNLDVLLNDETEWIGKLWLDLIRNRELVKLSYSEMLVDEKEKERFKCDSDWLTSSSSSSIHDLKACLPFFWILISQFDELYVKNKEISNAQSFDNLMSQLFESKTNQIFALVD